ncbi:MAG: hypothetical protein HOW73_20090 [Polyangiaceae bacterium]|nr:hypothetical protein [Polyangiaceae bacterium]
MLEMFRLGGWGMIPTCAFGLMALAAAIRYALSPKERFVPLQLTLGALTLVCGALGLVTGLIKSFSAMGEVSADERWIWMIGTGESLHNLALAFALVALATLASSIGALRIARAPE